MNTLLVLRGIQASGKSTFALDFIKNNPSFKRVNRDSLRMMINNYNFPNDEKLIKSIRDDLIYKILRRGFDVILDDMNLDNIDDFIEIARNVGNIKLETKWFDISLEIALERNLKREGCGKIPENAIIKCFNKIKNVSKIDEIIYFPEIIKNEYDKNLPDCIIVDIDGTLALHGKREVYDLSKVLEDDVNKSVNCIINAINFFNNEIKTDDTRFQIILCSGREDYCKGDTEKWLENNEIEYDKLFMRKTKDTRNDAIIKREIYDNEIKGKYNVLFCVDDRNRVVNAYRGLGLTCFQIANGDF